MSVVRQSLQSLRSFFVNLVVWLFLIGIYGGPLLILGLWRFTVNLLAKKIHTDLVACSPNDTLLVYDTPDNQPVLTGGVVLKVKGRVDTGKLKVLFEELFLSQENFKNYKNLYCDLVKFGGYLFKREIVPKVKLENHFVERELGNGEDFKVVMGSWFQEKFQKGLPLWQLIVLHGNVEGGGSFVAFKAHHGLMDGYSFVHVLDKLTGVTSPGEWGANNNKPGDVKDLDAKQEKTLWEKVKILFSAPEVVASFTFPNISFRSAFPSCKSLSNFEMMPLACGTSALEPIQDIKMKLGVHFPALIYGLQGGVIRAALLDGIGSSPEKSSVTEETLPEHILISTSLPIVGHEHPRSKLTNHWSGGYIKVPLKTASAKERIRQANQSLESIFQNEGTFITWKYLAFFLWLFPAWFHYSLNKCQFLKLFKYQSSMSCIPQSCLVQYNLMGLPVENIYHAPIMKDTFLTAVLLGCSSSHHDQVDFSLFGHPDWFPDQDAMNQVMSVYMRKELELLASECDIDFSSLEWRVS